MTERTGAPLNLRVVARDVVSIVSTISTTISLPYKLEYV